MTRGAEYLIGLPKILELPDIKIDRNNRMVLESGALKIIRKVRPGMYLCICLVQLAFEHIFWLISGTHFCHYSKD